MDATEDKIVSPEPGPANTTEDVNQITVETEQAIKTNVPETDNDDSKEKVEENDTLSKTETSMPVSLSHNATEIEDAETKSKAEGAISRSVSHSTTEKGDCSTSRGSYPVLIDLRESEKSVLLEFRSMVEEAILLKKIFRHKENAKAEKQDSKGNDTTTQEKTDSKEKADIGQKDQESNKGSEETTETPLLAEQEKVVNNEDQRNADYNKEKGKEIVAEDSDTVVEDNDKKASENEEIFLWGVPLLPSRGDERTDVILVKFLRARDFKANDAFDMLRNTLQWRLDNKTDSILEEDLGFDFLDSMAFIDGVDREGHLVCYNLYGLFANEEFYSKTFGSLENREKFLRWRVQLMERQIQKLDFSPGRVSSLLQINDLKDTSGPTRKDMRLSIRKVVELLQDNYPEFVVRNVFVNVPFWYYAFNAVWYPFLTQRTKSKFVFARSTKVTDNLLKYITAEEIPAKYGGLKRENDPDFSTTDAVSEVVVSVGSVQTIDIPAPEVGRRLVWDLTVVGWDVNYKEEFVPTDEKSYALIIKREKNLVVQEEPIRNSFQTKETGKVVLTIRNGMFKKKKILYRYKTDETISAI